MEATATTLEVSIFNDATTNEVFKNGGQILDANTLRADKAVAIGNKIMADVKAAGGKLTPELDARCQSYLANCANAAKEMNNARAPITRRMDEVKKLFTEAENNLDSKKLGTPAYAIQVYRDAYAKQLADEERAKEQEALRVAAKAQEAISISGAAERILQSRVNAMIDSAIRDINSEFYGIKLLVFDAAAELFSLTERTPFQQETFDSLCGIAPIIIGNNIQISHHNEAEIKDIISGIGFGRFEEFAPVYNAAINARHAELISQLSSRKSELEALANADADTKKKLEEEAEQRRKDEEERLKNEATKRTEDAEATITAQTEERVVDVLFAQETAIASVHVPKPESRQAVGITVTDAQGWPLIFQTWFTHEGSLLGVDAALKVSLGSMIKFCEARAKKFNERIDSPFIVYSNNVRAVNRK